MRIVQTFCSFDRDLLNDSFGWLTPQHHIMAWTLSCLNLKKWYDDIHFYTDSPAKKLLINYLGLPYTQVHCCYDKMDYGPNLFALPKLMTYSMQTTPFIHVDGDVFIWEKFSPEIEQAGLVAQNIEKGTSYYKTIMAQVQQPLIALPALLKAELEKEPISSVNAGILGGSDLSFIQQYTKAAFDFIKSNHQVADALSVKTSILFEQILFHALVQSENKTVTYYFDETFDDDGYYYKIFSDFTSVPYQHTYLHLIGESKKGKLASRFIESTLLKQYPEYYARIIHLFKSGHCNYNTRKTILKEEDSSAMMDVETNLSLHRRNQAANNPNEKIAEYEKELALLTEEWKDLDPAHLHSLELSSTAYFDFFYDSIPNQENYVLSIHPYLAAIEPSFEWDKETFKLLLDDPEKEYNDQMIGVVCVPELFFSGYREVVVDAVTYNILVFLSEPTTVKELTMKIQGCYPDTDPVDYPSAYQLVLRKLKMLFANKCVFIPEHL